MAALNQATYVKKDLCLYKNKKAIVDDKKEYKKPATLHAGATAVFPGITFFYENGYSRHFQYVHNANNYSLQTIDQKNHRSIPSFKPYAIQGYQIDQYEQIVACR